MKITYKKKNLNLLKKGAFVLAATSMVGSIAALSYSIYLDNKLKKIELDDEKLNAIKDFYNTDDPNNIIITLNDSQGVNLNVGFWKDSYPEYLEEALDAKLIDASSLRYNKTSHIDMLLKHNLTISELKELNNAGIKVAVQTLAQQINIPTEFLQNLISEIGVNILGQESTSEEEKQHISDMLAQAEQPIVIYSSGANDIMFVAKANPASIKKYDSEGHITPKYLYAKNKLENTNAISDIITDIETNFKNILSINPNTKIVVLSIYVPKSLQSEDYQFFIDAIHKYNLQLKQLSEKYGAVYIDETELGTIYNQDSFNFHINEIGHKQLAATIVDEIYDSISSSSTIETNYSYDYSYDNLGLTGFYQDLAISVLNVEILNEDEMRQNDYLFEVYEQQTQEKITDANTCKTLIKEKE